VKTSQPAGEPKPKKTKKKEERKIRITGWQLIYRSCALFIFYFDIIVTEQTSKFMAINQKKKKTMRQNEESVGYGPRPTAPKKRKKSLAAQPSINQLKCRHIV
jgi:hypothetical protein